MKFRILVTEPQYFGNESIDILKSIGSVHKIRTTQKILYKIIADFDAIVCRIETHLDKKTLSVAKNLKIIGSATTGLDHIDTQYAHQHHIKVIGLHGTHTIPTAEHAFALILSLARNVPWAYQSLSRGHWHRYKFIGVELYGKTIGIIGLGRIGKRVAKYAKAFGMNVIYYDPYVKANRYKKVSLKELISSSDIISIHAMLNKQDLALIGPKEFKEMKMNAMLINTARGKIVDYNALILALGKKQIRGAALDVFTEEPFVDKRSKIIDYARRHSNLIITPHIGASTEEAVHDAAIEIATNVKKALKELPIEND